MSFYSKIQSASLTPCILRAAALVAALAIVPAANAQLYWDQDNMLGGSGTWDINTTMNWSTTNAAGAPDSTWTPNDGTQEADFNGSAAYTVTIPTGTTIDASSLEFGNTGASVKITGGTIHIANPTNSIVMNTLSTGPIRLQTIESIISGTDIMVYSGTGPVRSNVVLGPSDPNPLTAPHNTFTGDLIWAGPTAAADTTAFADITIPNPNALPSTATLRMQRNNCQLLWGVSGVGYTSTFNNNIVLNDGASTKLTQSIGAFDKSLEVTMGGVISGNADLIFQLGAGGGQGKMILANHETYTGSTQINTNANGRVALGINDALPVGTTFTETKGSFDMAGFNQQVGGLAGGSNGVVSNTSATTSTLTISGNVIGDFAGIIGAISGTVLPGTNDNIALVLASTNTGSLTLSHTTGATGGNTYNGGTTISGGKLYAANDFNLAGSATGTGPVAVNNGGTLGGNGSIGGAITVASGGHITGGLRTGANQIGTLIAFNAVTLNSGSNLDIDLGAPAPSGGSSDQVSLNGFLGSFALTVPAAASSVGVNLSDPAGGAAGNGTYILMTFPAGSYTGSTNASQFHTASLPSSNSLNGSPTFTYHLADDTNTIQEGGNAGLATRVIMTITGGPNALLWKGAASGAWDTSAGNFDNLGTGATGVAFANNDNVTFDDTGSNTNPVMVAAGGVQPNIITIKNTTTTYSFSGGDIKGSSIGGGGGLYMSGNGDVTIGSNYTAAGPITIDKSDPTTPGTVNLNGNITAATSLTVNGGTVTLTGANTYTGDDTVNGGTLGVSGASATFGSGNLDVKAGHAAIDAGVTNAIDDAATLTLAGGGTANMADAGYIDLGAGIDEQVGMLVLGTMTFTSGTFGSTSSAAANMMNEYFAGTGIITVVGSLPGDYNGDGKVDAADYVIWRKGGSPNPNSPGDYATWRTNFGNGTPGSGSSLGATAAVPEPATMLLVVMGIAALSVGRLCRRDAA